LSGKGNPGEDFRLASERMNDSRTGLAAELVAGQGNAGSDEVVPLSLEQLTAVSDRKLRTWKNSINFEVDNDIDTDALSAALATVCARHDALRMRLVGAGQQRFSAPVRSFPIGVARCADLAAMAGATEEFFGEDIDLVNEGPLRTQLLRVPGGPTRLLCSVHHVAWDGLSTVPFNRDLWASYTAYHAGHEPTLAPLRGSYRDYVLGQQANGRDWSAEQERYWAEIFSDWRVGEGFGTPVDRGTGRPRDWWIGTLTEPVPNAPLQDRMRRLARAIRVTPSTLWLAATFVALWSRHHSDAVCVYWIHHGRDRAELFDLVGYFSRVVPLRLIPRPRDHFGDVCTALFEQTRSAIRYSAAPWQITALADRVVGPRPEPVVGARQPKRPKLSKITVNVLPTEPVPVLSMGDGVARYADYEGGYTPRPGQLWLLTTLGGAPSSFAEFDRRRFPDEFATYCLRAADEVASIVADRGVGITLGELRGLLAN
jgi:hypothetical protein